MGCHQMLKLQLSSAEKRLPIIVLHWLDNSKSRNHRGGQLLVYGGDEIGCEEVVTVSSTLFLTDITFSSYYLIPFASYYLNLRYWRNAILICHYLLDVD